MIESGDLRLSPKTEKPQYRLAASDETNLERIGPILLNLIQHGLKMVAKIKLNSAYIASYQ